MNEQEAASRWIKGMLRAEMVTRGITYADLALRLNAIGIDENEKNLANRIGRGTFSAILFMQCLSAMGVRRLNFHPWQDKRSWGAHTNDEAINLLIANDGDTME